MESVFRDFDAAYAQNDGSLLASTVTPIAPATDPGRLHYFYRATNAHSAQDDIHNTLSYSQAPLSDKEFSAWVDIYTAYWRFLGEFLIAEEATNSGRAKEAEWNKVYDAWTAVVKTIDRGYGAGGFRVWTINLLYTAGTYLRTFAIKADESANAKGSVTFNDTFQDDVVRDMKEMEKLEDVGRHLNRLYALCAGDRAPVEESRKWGVYYIANLQFKTYFRLNQISLCKNVIRSVKAMEHDMPDLSQYPKSDRVTWKYYNGVVAFLEEDYRLAEENLSEALRLCHRSATKNLELILTYLIPCHLLTSHTLPTANLLAPFPRLRALFDPLAACIKRGDLAGFDAALAAGEDEFVKRRIYLTLERGRDIALRNLFRKVHIAGRWEEDQHDSSKKVQRSRVPLSEFGAAMRLGVGEGNEVVEQEEVECMIANLIYKGFMKGYIARANGLVVLSKTDAFPGTGI